MNRLFITCMGTLPCTEATDTHAVSCWASKALTGPLRERESWWEASLTCSALQWEPSRTRSGCLHSCVCGPLMSLGAWPAGKPAKGGRLAWPSSLQRSWKSCGQARASHIGKTPDSGEPWCWEGQWGVGWEGWCGRVGWLGWWDGFSEEKSEREEEMRESFWNVLRKSWRLYLTLHFTEINV